MYNLQKRLSTRTSDVHERLKTNGTSIKIARETTYNQEKKYNSGRRIQRTIFTKTSI